MTVSVFVLAAAYVAVGALLSLRAYRTWSSPHLVWAMARVELCPPCRRRIEHSRSHAHLLAQLPPPRFALNPLPLTPTTAMSAPR